MASNTGTAVATTAQATTTVACTILLPGFMHLIGERPDNATIVRKMLTRNAKRYAPTITFKNGQRRRVVIGVITEVGTEVRFEGSMPNGNDLVVVSGAFQGANGGYVRIDGILSLD